MHSEEGHGHTGLVGAAFKLVLKESVMPGFNILLASHTFRQGCVAAKVH